jgi:parallel beta-helix repeat protein
LTGDGVYSCPAVVGGRVYVGSYDGRVYCLDALTGGFIWSYTTGSGVASSPAVADGKVYVGSVDRKVYCLDAASGAHIWNYTTGGNVPSSPAVVGGRVYVGSYDSFVYCLDALTGAPVWHYTTGGYVWSSPAVADGKVYVGSWDGRVYCLDALTGGFIWRYATGSYVFSSPAVADGVVFIGSYDYAMYAIGNVIMYPEDGHATLQAAINAAPAGSTISVAVGVYHESIVINKSITILGRKGSAPIFDGGGSGIFATIVYSGFGSTLAGVVITNWDQGIVIDDAGNCKIYDNIMALMSSNGISIEGSNAVNNRIYSNIFQDSEYAVAITVFTSSPTNIIQKNIVTSNNVGLALRSNGNIVYENSIVENNAGIDVSSSSNNVIYHNNFANSIANAITGGLHNVWDDGYPSGGNFWSSYVGTDIKKGPYQDIPGSDGMGDTNYAVDGNNVDRYPLMKFFNPCDIGVIDVFTSKTVIGQGFPLSIEVRCVNYGICDEIFSLTAYSNMVPIETQTIALAKRNSGVAAFIWNTISIAKGTYTISAYAWPLQGETETMDNSFEYGDVLITIPGDINGDGWVNAKDAIALGTAFYPFGDYSPNSDINGDGYCNAKDAVILGTHFGEHW